MITGLIIGGCWAVSFVFAGLEAGLLSIDQVRLRYQVKRGNASALALNRLLREPERLLVTILLVTNLADISALLLLTRRLVGLFAYRGYFVALVIALPIYIFVLGVLPKSLFRRFPFRALATLAGLLAITSTLLWPILELGAGFGRLVLRRKVSAERLFAGREDLKQIAAESEREGSLTAAERSMIHNVVDFRTVKASDVMVPLSKVVTVTPDTAIDDLIRLSATTGVDRLPVISGGKAAMGLVNILDLLFDRARSHVLGPYMRRIVIADENESAYRVIRRLRAARLGLAAVIDAQKQLLGIVTVEDLIKRLIRSA
ncbi:MAG: CNNM domain-containing protein [Verrucomicrobiota bacterium]